jgi:hypothetical protein
VEILANKQGPLAPRCAQCFTTITSPKEAKGDRQRAKNPGIAKRRKRLMPSCIGDARHISRSRCATRFVHNARKDLTRPAQGLQSCRPVRRGCFREALLKQDGMRRPASLCMHTDAREAPERHRPPATTGGTCEGHRSCATPQGMAKAGSAPKNRRGGAPRGERPPARRHGESLPARGRADLRYWSALNGCRCTRAPVGAPLPSFTRGRFGKARRP